MIRFEVLTTQWGAEDDVFQGGVHEIAKPTVAFLRLLAGAEAAGSVVVLEAADAHRARLDKAVQSQDDGEAAYQRALEQGRWQHGNLVSFIADRQARLDYDKWLKTAPVDELVKADLPPERGGLTGEEIATIEQELAAARATLETTEVPE